MESASKSGPRLPGLTVTVTTALRMARCTGSDRSFSHAAAMSSTPSRTDSGDYAPDCANSCLISSARAVNSVVCRANCSANAGVTEPDSDAVAN